jgi:hypothetical protein
MLHIRTPLILHPDLSTPSRESGSNWKTCSQVVPSSYVALGCCAARQLHRAKHEWSVHPEGTPDTQLRWPPPDCS